ncbi:MAG: hypothetical protein ACXWVH_05085 [Caulobacteraceae bacterium]
MDTTEPTPSAAPSATVQNVYVQPPAASHSNGFATASLVLGIISLVMAFIPVVGMIAWITAPLGAILGGVALTKPAGRGLAIGGLATSIIALLICFMWATVFGAAISAAGASANAAANAQVEATPST